jgi:hypothetical protein
LTLHRKVDEDGLDMLGKKTGGRQKGTKNKPKVDIEKLLAAVERGSGKTLDEWLSSTLMDRKTRVPILLQLLAYRYGKPKERVEVSGGISSVHKIIAEARARVASLTVSPAPVSANTPLLPAPLEPEILPADPAPYHDHDHDSDQRLRRRLDSELGIFSLRKVQ